MNCAPPLTPGTVMSNQEICDVFQCSPQGGMRRSKKTNTLVLISNHVKSIYHDRRIGDEFHYTGMGMECNQRLDVAQNKTLAESSHTQVSVHLFEVFKAKEYTYVGKVALARAPYQAQQPDQHGDQRRV